MDQIIGFGGSRPEIWAFVGAVDRASPAQLMTLERAGVEGRMIKAMAGELRLPVASFYEMLGMPKATIEKKTAANEPIAGAHGHAALGMAKLLATASNIVANSTAKDAEKFDVGKWLGAWINRPQAALGGKKPAAFLDTPTGAEIVNRLLGAIESGAYL
jgi:putative toxin-antitoxin system antitoxin component (TIGR02293 family)